MIAACASALLLAVFSRGCGFYDFPLTKLMSEWLRRFLCHLITTHSALSAYCSCRCTSCRIRCRRIRFPIFRVQNMRFRYFHFLYGGFLCTSRIAKNFMTCIAGPVLLSSIRCTRFFNSRMICQLMPGCCYGHCVLCRFSCSGFVSEQGAASSAFPMLMLSCFRTARRFLCLFCELMR